MASTDSETYECVFTVNVELNEDDEMSARHILAEQLERIVGSLRDGMRSEGRVMHPNGHAIGAFALIQTNLPDD